MPDVEAASVSPTWGVPLMAGAPVAGVLDGVSPVLLGALPELWLRHLHRISARVPAVEGPVAPEGVVSKPPVVVGPDLVHVLPVPLVLRVGEGCAGVAVGLITQRFPDDALHQMDAHILPVGPVQAGVRPDDPAAAADASIGQVRVRMGTSGHRP